MEIKDKSILGNTNFKKVITVITLIAVLYTCYILVTYQIPKGTLDNTCYAWAKENLQHCFVKDSLFNGTLGGV